MPILASVSLALIGLLAKTVVDRECETISENVRYERCQQLQHHPIWLFAPSLLVLGLGWLVAWRQPRWSFLVVGALGLVLLAVATFWVPLAWLRSAPAGGP